MKGSQTPNAVRPPTTTTKASPVIRSNAKVVAKLETPKQQTRKPIEPIKTPPEEKLRRIDMEIK